MEWAGLYLPEGRHYVGLTPMRSPLYLDESETSRLEGHPDLFKRSIVAVVAPHNTVPEAIRLATDFIHLLGAEHMFVDAQELDGLIAATHILPEILAAALVNATTSQPGWLEGRKFADQAYAAVSGPAVHSGPAASLTSLALNEPQNSLRVIDNAITSLSVLRDMIQKGDAQAIESYFGQARQSREQWWQQRGAANWEAEQQKGMEMPTAGEVFGRIFGLGKPKEPKPRK
jgi:prephenate dehydrogenase